jgi:hypothetical protein
MTNNHKIEWLKKTTYIFDDSEIGKAISALCHVGRGPQVASFVWDLS